MDEDDLVSAPPGQDPENRSQDDAWILVRGEARRRGGRHLIGPLQKPADIQTHHGRRDHPEV